LVIEIQYKLHRLAIAQLPGRITDPDDPSAIGVLRKDERKPVVEFGDGGAVGKCTFVGRVSGALPFSDTNDAEWTSGETCGAERDARKRRQQYPRHFRHDKIPPRKAAEEMLSQVVSRASGNDADCRAPAK
jgi:hypothetical protein